MPTNIIPVPVRCLNAEGDVHSPGGPDLALGAGEKSRLWAGCGWEKPIMSRVRARLARLILGWVRVRFAFNFHLINFIPATRPVRGELGENFIINKFRVSVRPLRTLSELN